MLVNVESEIFGAAKTGGVGAGAASHVEHSAKKMQRVVREYRRELWGGKRHLPSRAVFKTPGETVPDAFQQVAKRMRGHLNSCASSPGLENT